MKTAKAGLLALVAGALMLGSSPSAQAQDKPTKAGMDAVFLQTVADGNMMEIASGKLALQRSRSKKVRDVARALVNGHRKALQDLYRVAGQTNTPLPTKMSAKSRQKYTELAGLRGNAFNKAFMAHQVKAHNATIDLIQKEMANGENSYARDYAAKWYGPVSDHTAMIYNTAGHFGVPVGASRTASRR
jgi:putative membrane protein